MKTKAMNQKHKLTTRGRRVKALVAALALVASQVLSVASLAPQTALAQDTTPQSVTVTGYSQFSSDSGLYNSQIHGHHATDQYGNQLYCGNFWKSYPGEGYTLSISGQGGLTLDYILYYGYGGSGYDGSVYGATGEAAMAATQVAVWIYTNGGDNAYASSTYSSQGWALYEAATNNADSSAIYAGTSWIYDDGVHQPLVGQTLRIGSVNLKKSSANTSITDGSGCYSLEGAEYGVYGDADCTQQVATLTTDANGDTNTVSLKAGHYYVKETKAPTGYYADAEVHGVDVVANETATVSVSDAPANDPFLLAVQKKDKESSSGSSIGGATLACAQFKINFYNGYYSSGDSLPSDPTRSWTIQTDSNGVAKFNKNYLVAGDDFYYQNGSVTLPLGTITVQETRAPAGYTADDTMYLANISFDGTDVKIVKIGSWSNKFDQEVSEMSVEDQAIRGDVKFVKAAEDSQSRLANVAFKLTSKTTGESHVIVTDENGMFDSASSWNKHSSNTNANDAAINADGTVDSSKLDAAAGVWFGLDGGGTTLVANDELGALPYDTYELEELRCDANEGHRLVSTTVTVSRDGVDLDLGTFDDKTVTIGTTLTYDGEDKSVPAGRDVTLTDAVRYENLAVGQEYTLSAELHEVDSDGSDLGVVSVATKAFTAAFQSDTVDVDLTVDTTDMGGKKLVCFETLYQGSDELAHHEDLADEGQTVRVPEIGTTLAGDLGHEADASKKTITLADTVRYTGLEAGKEYTVTGTLHVKADDGTDAGELKDAEGNAVTASTTFTPETADGTVDVTFELEDIDVAGETVVAYEDLTRNGITYATHSDISAEDQSAHFPSLHTTALGGRTADHDIDASDGQTVTDTVDLTNLTVGNSYVVRGELHLLDEQGGDAGIVTFGDEVTEVTGELSFTADAANCSKEIEFNLDSTELAGKTLVVTETLYGVDERGNETKLGEHADLADEGQTVCVPMVGTQLTNDETGRQDVQIGDSDVVSLKLTDTIAYTNLLPGREYTVTGTLHVKADDGTDAGELKDAEGNAVTASTTFTPEASDGTVDVTFELDAKRDGVYLKSVVAFETLTRAKAGDDAKTPETIEVAKHEDISDEGQTVNFCDVHTTARDAADGDSTVSAAANQKLIDTISYENLVPGREYTVTGTLHVKADDGTDAGELKDAEGNAVTASTTFTPEASDGTVDVTFELDASDLDGKTLVAFEDVSVDGITVATHADITDDGQSVVVKKPAYPDTGQASSAAMAGVVGAVLVGVTAAGLALEHVRSKRDDETVGQE